MPERKKEKAYMVDSDLSLQDVTCRHGGPTQISGVRLPWGTPKLWLHRDWGWCGLLTAGQPTDRLWVVRGRTGNFRRPTRRAVAVQKEILSFLGSFPCLASRAPRMKSELRNNHHSPCQLLETALAAQQCWESCSSNIHFDLKSFMFEINFSLLTVGWVWPIQ